MYPQLIIKKNVLLYAVVNEGINTEKNICQQ